ncbi:hypothetical protein K8R43_02185 [archaeon]|nr:hypothetical protein [archaeon]
MAKKLPRPVKAKIGKRKVNLYEISHSLMERIKPKCRTGVMWPETKKYLAGKKIVCHEKNFDKGVIDIPEGTKSVNIDMEKRGEWNGKKGLKKRIETIDNPNDFLKESSKEHEKTIKDIIKTLGKLDKKEKTGLLENKEKLSGLKKTLKLSDRDMTFYTEIYPFIPKTLKEEKITPKEIKEAIEYRRWTEDYTTMMHAQMEPSKEKILPLIEKFAFPTSSILRLRDAYMAEKIHHVIKKHGDVPVFIGKAHVEGVKRYLEHPEERQRLIEFFKKETPKSYKELQKFKKQHQPE